VKLTVRATVPLPAVFESDDARQSQTQESAASALASAGDGREPVIRPLRILLAEDNAVNRFLAVRLLENQGHRVETAGTGSAVIAAFERGDFDVVLMDFHMPELDGLQATRIIRARERGNGRRVPIIALTASAMVGDYERGIEAGMDGYVSKPIDLGKLLAEIRRVTSLVS
jgi:CheY-like chemotaxis protein